MLYTGIDVTAEITADLCASPTHMAMKAVNQAMTATTHVPRRT